MNTHPNEYFTPLYLFYSTVTDLARFFGLSISQSFNLAVSYAISCRAVVVIIGLIISSVSGRYNVISAKSFEFMFLNLLFVFSFEKLFVKLFFVFVSIFISPEIENSVEIFKSFIGIYFCLTEFIGQRYFNRTV